MTLPSKLLIILILSFCLAPGLAKGQVSIDNPLKAENFAQLLNAIIDIIWYISVGIAPIMITIAGFYFITAMGDPKKIDTAKKLILWVLIGLIIVTSAKGIIELFQQIFLKTT